MGDITREPDAYIKYGYLLKAVNQIFPLVGSVNAKLQGLPRLVNALLTIHPNQKQWRARFYHNEFAFRARSRRVATYLKSMDNQIDVILQIGGMFDANWNGLAKTPNIIYTDYTAHLSAQKPEAGRSPFISQQQKRWITLERQALARATHVCTRSKFVRDSIITDYNIPPERVTAIGGGINFVALPELTLPKSNDKPLALFIGRDFYRKGGDILLRAFALVRSQIPEARLLVSTKDPIPSDLPLEGVELVDSEWNQATIEALYRQANVFVLPSRLETWGDVLLEAMSYGLPCIGVSSEAMPEIIENEVTGLIVPPENIEALAAALIRLFTNTQLCHQWGQAARQRVEQLYTWDRVVERLSPFIEAAARKEQEAQQV